MINSMGEEIFKKAFELISQSRNILLVTHLRPDGDAVGSACAMAEYLSSAAKRYSIYCQDRPPEKFGFLDCLKRFRHRTEAGEAAANTPVDIGDFDLIIVLDCASLPRTALASEIMGRRAGAKVIEFDHHPSADSYADLEIRDTLASSTSELVYRFFKINRISLNKKMAEAVLTGISTDTENFLYPSTSSSTIRISSELMLAGARLPKVVSHAYRDKAVDSLRIWGAIMSKLKINKKYNLAIAAITHEEISGQDMDREILEGISNFLGNLKGVKAVFFLREVQAGVVNGSIRTADPKVDVSRLAQIFGGGGHKKSSAFAVSGRLIETDSGWKII